MKAHHALFVALGAIALNAIADRYGYGFNSLAAKFLPAPAAAA